jgi:hypothetical protein
MIKVGDIVYRKYKGGLRNNKPNTSELGLVIKEHGTDSPISVPQYYVRFNQKDPKWYFTHDLYRITPTKERK